MPRILTLTRVADPSTDSWLTTVAAEYGCGKKARVFAGIGISGERVAMWIKPDGSGFGAIDARPDLFIRACKAASRGDFSGLSTHGGVDEYEFEPGSFDYNADEIGVTASLSLV